LSGLDGEQRLTLSVARDSGTALMRIIDDILDFSKIEANSLELNLVAGSVASVVTNACRLHAKVASGRKLVLRTDISAQISPMLLFDALRLGQILNNFLSNAIKFTAAGHVDVSVEKVGRRGDMEELRFVVRDTGIGMTPAQVGRLFQPFVQAAAATSAQFGGTGLGLVISRRLAKLMGGTVEVESELGVGTSIALKLPFEICRAIGPVRSEPADNKALKKLVSSTTTPPTGWCCCGRPPRSAMRPRRWTTARRHWTRGAAAASPPSSPTAACLSWMATSWRARSAKRSRKAWAGAFL
jgi:hypothetical protein